jgi:hypothetical protein
MDFESACAIFFALILVTTPMTAAASVRPADSGFDSSQSDTFDSTRTTYQSSPEKSLVARASAYDALRAADLPGSGKRKDTLVSTLNGTFDAYVDPDRVSSPVFTTDKQIAAKTQNHAPRVAEELLASDAKLAHIAVKDAERTLSELQSRDAQFDSAAVHDDLETARRALQRGDDLRAKGSVGAFVHYGTAWTNAQRALDRMDAAVEPTVNITRRVDPPRNGSTVYTVTGTVFDVRTRDLQNATVTVNGETAPLHLVGNTTPGGLAVFRANVTIPNGPVSITVSITDPGVTYAERATSGSDSTEKAADGKSKKGKPVGRNSAKGKSRNGEDAKDDTGSAESTQSVSAPEQSGFDTLLLDEDLLPDRYERATVGTDPLAADSDSNRTDDDESKDAVVDGREDFDDDLVQTYTEYRAGTNPHDPDTDDDRLLDWFELRYDDLDPLAADTDGDSTADAAEDFDGEGLENEREQTHWTDPHDPDTDDDNLTDAYEVDATKTVPVSADSDSNRTEANEAGDGVLDGREDFENDTLTAALEAEIGTDPFDPDTDDDRLLDPFEHE